MEKDFLKGKGGKEKHTPVFFFIRSRYIYLYYLGYDREAITCLPEKEKKKERCWYL